MLKKIIAMFLICAMLIPFSSTVAAYNENILPSTDLDDETLFEELLTMDPELDSDGDGLVDVIERYYGFNHLHTDTDGDGVTDFTEFTRTCTNVSYRIKTNWFYENNTQYNQGLAITSSLLSSIAYDGNYLGNTSTSASNPVTAVEDWFNYHNFTGYDCYDLDYNEVSNPLGYQDQHVSEMYVAYKKLYHGSAKTLICVIVRGTNGTLDEWQSNFDMGNSDDYHMYSGWTNPNNHMGFDITANRLNEKLSQFISENNLANDDIVLWITGHSRGGALANLLAAKQVLAGREVFAYTFAAPATTTLEDAQASDDYKCIFNIINNDDFVPRLPLSAWNFKRYGVDKPASIETGSGYAAAWDALIDGDSTYKTSLTLLDWTITSLQSISASRNGCYAYRTDEIGYFSVRALLRDQLELRYENTTDSFPEIAREYWYTGDLSYNGFSYSYRIYQQPAFLMQVLAYTSSNACSDKTSFIAVRVAPYLAPAKYFLAGYSYLSFIDHPHYTESYYLLANYITE